MKIPVMGKVQTIRLTFIDLLDIID